MNLTWWYYAKSNLKVITKEKFTQLKQKKVVFLFVFEIWLIEGRHATMNFKQARFLVVPMP